MLLYEINSKTNRLLCLFPYCFAVLIFQSKLMGLYAVTGDIQGEGLSEDLLVDLSENLDRCLIIEFVDLIPEVKVVGPYRGVDKIKQ